MGPGGPGGPGPGFGGPGGPGGPGPGFGGPGWGPGIFPPIGGFFAGFSDMIFYLVSAAAGCYEIALEGHHHHRHFFLLIIDRLALSPSQENNKDPSPVNDIVNSCFCKELPM
ncbi:BnaA04g29510D [Brassica napus]|uniref:BnaA04g29510D protein n=1 Tax=Brassica napus TaxID=3708 RepID=A0A078J0Y9_BRANA|nr:BnaA04g29510D [Brassica napus]